jgi:branched-chain amino acid transport system substrate-binding protein
MRGARSGRAAWRLAAALCGALLVTTACGSQVEERVKSAARVQVSGGESPSTEGAAGQAGTTPAPEGLPGGSSSEVVGTQALNSSAGAAPVGASRGGTSAGSAAAKPAGGSKSTASKDSAAQGSSPGLSPSTPNAPSGVPAPGAGAAVLNSNPDEGFTASEIKIGLMCALSGPFASVTKLGCYASQAIFKEINATGGINGRKLTVIIRDDQFAGPQGQTVIRQFIDQDKVFLIDGGASPFGMVLTANYIDEKKVPAFSPGVFLSEYGHPYVFVNLPPTVIAGGHLAGPYLVKEFGAKRIGLVTHSEAEWVKGADEFKFAVEQSGGQVVSVQKAAMDDRAYNALVLNMQRDNPDAVYLNLMPDGIIKWYLAAKQVNYKPKILNPPTGEAELVPDGVGDFAYPYITTTCLDPPLAGTPRGQRFLSIVTKYYPNEDWKIISTGTRQLYAIARLIPDALRATGADLSRQKFMDTMHSRAWDTDGMNPPLRWEPTHKQPPFTAALVTEFDKASRTWKKRTEYIQDPWANRY